MMDIRLLRDFIQGLWQPFTGIREKGRISILIVQLLLKLVTAPENNNAKLAVLEVLEKRGFKTLNQKALCNC